MTTFLMLLAGLGLLVIGAELLVRGASAVAGRFGVSQLVIGLTVVAYGTSTPELAVSLLAGLGGQDDLAVANVVGSNIFNVVFILGLCAIIAPLAVHPQLVRRELPILVGASVLTLLLALDGRIGRLDAMILTAGIVVYTVRSIQVSLAEGAAAADPEAPPEIRSPWVVDVVQIAAGLGTLVLGSRLLIDGATDLARGFGVSDTVIGLTLVAAGTSLPEVATSVLATVRGQRDIAIGNVVGSNIYNLLAILGAAGLVTPGGLSVAPQMLAVDVPLMIAVAVILVPIFYSGWTVDRTEGVALFGVYLGYTAWLVLAATGSPSLAFVEMVLLAGGTLLTVVLATQGARAWATQDPHPG